MRVKFPGPTDRLYISGRTGSGKTTAGLWQLSGKDFNERPWLLVNTKGDQKVNAVAAIKGVQTITVNDTPGEHGLYHVAPRPDDGVALDAMFGRIWEKRNCGIYIDEGYMIDPTDNLNACLTQGRTLGIPMIVLSQRPAWLTKFVESEADFVQLFNLSRLADRKNIGGLVPVDKNYRLARYCSYWCNVADDELAQFAPVPDSAVILNTFRAMFPPEHAQEAGDNPAPKGPMTKRVI